MSYRQSVFARLTRHWRSILEIAATVLAIVVCINLLLAMGRPNPPVSPTERRGPVRPPPPPPPKLPAEPISLGGAPTEGAKSAKAAIITYSDFQCPYCGRFARDTQPTIRKEYIETGKVLMVFRHVPLPIHPFAEKAAESAECAGRQGKFWPMHDLLFQDQRNLELPSLELRARQVGLNMVNFAACLAGQTSDRIRRDEGEAATLGITGTPTFLFGILQPNETIKVTARRSGALPIERFRAVLDDLLESLTDSK